MRADRTTTSAGLTLIELMVAMVLASMLSGGVFYMMSGQTNTYREQLQGISVEQNITAAAEYLERQVALAGYNVAGTCTGARGAVAHAGQADGPEVFRAITIYSACDLLHVDPRAASTNCCSNANLDACIQLAATDQPDAFSVTYHPHAVGGEPTVVRTTAAMATNSTQTLVSAAADFHNGDLILIREPGTVRPCLVRRLNNDPQFVSGAWRLTHSDAVLDSGAGLPANIDYGVNSLVTNLGSETVTRHFAIDRHTMPPRLVTWVTNNANPSADLQRFEVVADDIEDMQIAYACDSDADGFIAEGRDENARRSVASDEWVANARQEIAPLPDCNARPLRLVRITLVGRSTGRPPTHQTFVEDRWTGAPEQRRTITVQVALKNIPDAG